LKDAIRPVAQDGDTGQAQRAAVRFGAVAAARASWRSLLASFLGLLATGEIASLNQRQAAKR